MFVDVSSISSNSLVQWTYQPTPAQENKLRLGTSEAALLEIQFVQLVVLYNYPMGIICIDVNLITSTNLNQIYSFEILWAMPKGC